MNIFDEVEALIAAGSWLAARRALESAIVASPAEHSLLSRLGVSFYETGDYPTALEHIEKAQALAPKCPVVLWDLAGTLQQLERHAEAAELYKAMTCRQIGWLAKDPCLGSRALAKGLIADSHFRLSRSLDALGRKEEADEAFIEHLDMRGPGCYSIYPLGKFPKRGVPLRLWRRRKLPGRQTMKEKDAC